MKKIILLSLVAMFVFACNEDDNNPAHKYGIKSGIITYKNSMMGMEAKITQYFKEFGDIESVITEMELRGQKNKQYSIRKDGYYYSYADGQKEGAKMKLDNKKDSSENQKLTEEFIISKGGKKVGNEKVLGKECVVYEMAVEGSVTKMWIWKNMMLKMVATENQMEIVMEATELKETSDFPAGVFDIPKDINFKEMTDQNMDFENPDAEG